MEKLQQEKKQSTHENEIDSGAKPNVPEMKFRAGAVSATVWQNSGQQNGEIKTFNTISMERSYKDKNDEWQNTTSMRINDLPKAALVLTKAYEYLVLNQMNKTLA